MRLIFYLARKLEYADSIAQGKSLKRAIELLQDLDNLALDTRQQIRKLKRRHGIWTRCPWACVFSASHAETGKRLVLAADLTTEQDEETEPEQDVSAMNCLVALLLKRNMIPLVCAKKVIAPRELLAEATLPTGGGQTSTLLP